MTRNCEKIKKNKGLPATACVEKQGGQKEEGRENEFLRADTIFLITQINNRLDKTNFNSFLFKMFD